MIKKEKEPESKVKGYRFLKYVYSPYEAEIIEGFLKSNGIDVLIEQEAIGKIFAITMNGIGRIKIFVKENSFKKAKELLSDVERKD